MMKKLPKIPFPLSNLPLELQYIITDNMEPVDILRWWQILEEEEVGTKHALCRTFDSFIGLAFPFGRPVDDKGKRDLHDSDYNHAKHYISMLELYWRRKAEASGFRDVSAS